MAKKKEEKVIEDLNKKLSLEEQIVILKKENTKLHNQIKLLRNKMKRVRAESSSTEESEIEEALSYRPKVAKKKPSCELGIDMCPKCNSALTKFTLPDKTEMVICVNKNCTYRSKVK
jgi:hypothetical protein